MCEWEWVPISATDWDRWIVASARHLPSVGSTGMLNVAAGLVVYPLDRSIDLRMKIHLQQYFESLGTGPRSECPPSLCSQHHVKYIHITASVLYICPGRAFSYNFRFHPLLPSLFLSFSFRFVCIFPTSPRPWTKGFQFKTAWWRPLSTFRTRPQRFLSSLASVIPDVAYSRLQGYIRILLPSVPDEFRGFVL